MNNCLNCGGETANPKYCSHSCAAKLTNKIPGRPSGPQKGIGQISRIQFCICEICGSHFVWNAVQKGSTRHCKNPICFKQFKFNVRQGKCGGLRINSTRVNRSIYKGFQMDSGAELAFAQLLDKHSIEWTKNSTEWFEYLPGKKYYPDFFLKDYNLWIEIKGRRYLRPDDQTRWNSVSNHEVIMSHDLKLPSKILAELAGNDPALQQ